MFTKIACLFLIVPVAILAHCHPHCPQSAFKFCDSKIPKPKCHLSGYNGIDGFNVFENKYVTLELSLTPDRTLEAAYVRLYYSYGEGSYKSKWYEWALIGYGIVCKNLKDGKCPLKCGKEFTYTYTMCIPKGAPYMKYNVKVEILDDKHHPVACTTYITHKKKA